MTGNLETLRLLLNHGASIEGSAGNIGTALRAAALAGNIETVNLLSQRGDAAPGLPEDPLTETPDSTDRVPLQLSLNCSRIKRSSKMVHNLLSAGAALSDLLRVLDALRTGKTSLKGPHSRPNEDDASQIFPSFQALEGWLYRPLDYSDGTELLNSSIIMTAQLSVFDAKLDSVAWEWRIPAAVRL